MTDHFLAHRLYGRSAGKPLSARQVRLMEDLLPRLVIPETPSRALDPRTLFAGLNEVWHLAGQALLHRDVGMLGVEPFLDGVAKVLGLIDDSGISNVRLKRGDARLVVEQFPDASLDRAFILFPDPWPKTRHHKRRIVQPVFVGALARVLKPGAKVRFATDWADYANAALHDFIADGRFVWTAEQAGDWRTPPGDHVTTRYQEKRLGDCAPVFLDFVFQPPG